mgnify:FL=1
MTPLRNIALVVFLSFSLSGCIGFGGGGDKKFAHAMQGGVEYGEASWYGKPYHGRKTASGEKYNMNELTAAHRTLPFGTKVKVTRLDNGRSVVVRINDRGPFVRGRVIDLSREGAKKIDMVNDGIADVRVEII